MTTTSTGVAEDVTTALDTEADAMQAFLSKWDVQPEDGETPSEREEPEQRRRKPVAEKPTTEDAPEDQTAEDEQPEETPGETTEDEGSNDETTTEGEKSYIEDDNAVIKVKVGEEEKEYSVSQLRRLAGQEAALTQKSQQTSEARKRADADLAKTTATLGALLEHAKKDFEPYSKLDFLALAKDPNVTAEELTVLRDAAQASAGKVKFLESELGGFMEAIQQSQQASLKEQALAAHKELSDPEKGIQGWGQKLYNEMVEYAIQSGMDAGRASSIVSATELKLIHKAMMFDRGKSKTVTTVTNKTPKRVVKTTSAPERVSKGPASDKSKSALKVMKSRPTTDNIANAFMSRWDVSNDD